MVEGIGVPSGWEISALYSRRVRLTSSSAVISADVQTHVNLIDSLDSLLGKMDYTFYTRTAAVRTCMLHQDHSTGKRLIYRECLVMMSSASTAVSLFVLDHICIVCLAAWSSTFCPRPQPCQGWTSFMKALRTALLWESILCESTHRHMVYTWTP